MSLAQTEVIEHDAANGVSIDRVMLPEAPASVGPEEKP